ncbi:MAG: PRC-barrel domain-containing protein [Methylovirgula sp.]|uniref:PRC-barrel domain-containing protein n=1 Tax=Methylovirgula sp. TaxID=1978224 RepID=UPI0030761E73
MRRAARALSQAVTSTVLDFARWAAPVAKAGVVITLAGSCITALADTKPLQTPLPAPKPAAAPGPSKDAVPAVVLDDKDIEGVMGREIYSIAGDDMGRIVDLLVDHRGNLRAAIIDFGGFLGVGSRKIAVDWHAIQFGQDRALLSLTRDQVRVAPEYKEGEPVVILGPSSSAPLQRLSAHQQQTAPVTAPAK